MLKFISHTKGRTQTEDSKNTVQEGYGDLKDRRLEKKTAR